MSPRAACRLEALGFQHVYDYVPGKVDWLARGLPREGEKAAEPRAGDAVVGDVATAGLEERVGDVRARVEASPYGFALVVSDGGVLLGRLRRAALEGDPDQRASAVMEAGPSTVRPDTSLGKMRARLEARDLHTAIVTTPDGVLVGVVRRGDL
jgi:hypothetical protein